MTKHIQETGVLAGSLRYLYTPSSFAEQVLFYATRIGHYYCDESYLFDNHSEIGRLPSHHLHYMLFYVKKGEMQLTLAGKDWKATSGDLVLFDCKLPHRYYSTSSDLEFYWIVLDGLTFPAYYEKILNFRNNDQVFTSSSTKDLELIINRMISMGDSFLLEIEMSKLIYSILCDLLLNKRQNRDPSLSLIQKAMTYMDQHFEQELTVNDIAQFIGFSSSYLTRCFRQQTGYSPYEYLTLKRIGKAKELLLSTNMTIGSIGEASGYRSEENFIRSFKKAVGVSPTVFRKYPI